MVSGWVLLIPILIIVFISGGIIGLVYIIRSSKWTDEEFRQRTESYGRILLGQNYWFGGFTPVIRKLWTWGCGLGFVIFILCCIYAMWSFVHVFILS